MKYVEVIADAGSSDTVLAIADKAQTHDWTLIFWCWSPYQGCGWDRSH